MVNIAFNREKNLCFGCISRHLSDTKQTTHTCSCFNSYFPGKPGCPIYTHDTSSRNRHS